MSSEEMQLSESEQLATDPVVEKTTEQIEADALATSIDTFNQSYGVAKMGKNNLSLKALQRVFDAVISFPLDEVAVNKLKKNTLEFEIFMNALAAIRSKAYINHIVEKRHGEQIVDEVATNAAPDVAEVIRENAETINTNEGENTNGTTQN